MTKKEKEQLYFYKKYFDDLYIYFESRKWLTLSCYERFTLLTIRFHQRQLGCFFKSYFNTQEY